MGRFSYLLFKIQDVKAKDYLSLLPFIIAICLKPFFYDKYKDYWLISEDKNEARDNGYWFFYYLRKNHPDIKSVYAILPTSYDYDKVAILGELVEYGSIKHWLIYLCCKYNISSQKGGKPNAALCAFFELFGVLKRNNVFLQHGITISDAKWLHAEHCDFSYFITGARPETDYVKKQFGYNDGVVQYTGFSRFDNLHDNKVHDGQILIMPSWRAWFSEKTAQVSKSDTDFFNSDYYCKWSELLENPKLNELIITNKLNVIFYPHRNMQKYISEFKQLHTSVIIASADQYDVQELLKSSALMITDYSSVFFDMAYMKKPIIFYQFDYEKFRQQQYQEGYFDYMHSSFAKYSTDSDTAVKWLEFFIANDYRLDEAYYHEHSKTFELFDSKNSERIYQLLK